MEEKLSYFDGDLLTLIGVSLLAFFMTAFTLGLAFPWAFCMAQRWQTNHTVIEGKRLQFTGRGIDLLGNWIKWWFFCIITLGIYSLWVNINILKWKTKNTSFVD